MLSLESTRTGIRCLMFTNTQQGHVKAEADDEKAHEEVMVTYPQTGTSHAAEEGSRWEVNAAAQDSPPALLCSLCAHMPMAPWQCR